MERFEPLGNGTGVFTTASHTFGADALRLAEFVPSGMRRVCEFGTGCGVIAVLLAARDPAVQVTALDIQAEAVSLAERGISHSGLADRVTTLTADWRCAPLPPASFDAVVCNPPYFPPATGGTSADSARRIARHEESPAAFDELCAAAAKLLKHGGRFLFCHRPERLCDLFVSLRAAGLEPKRLRTAQHDSKSSPFLLLCEARKGGRAGLVFEPAFTG